MVLLHIISHDRQQASQIVDLLVEKNLVLTAVTLQEVAVKEKEPNGEMETTTQILIIGRTKGILFNTIETCLREAFPTNEPVIYSMPIVNMNWQEANALASLEAKDL